MYDTYYPHENISIEVVFEKVIYPVEITIKVKNTLTKTRESVTFHRALLDPASITYDTPMQHGNLGVMASLY